MARIAGVDLPRDKRVEYALLSIFGIGLTSSRDILAKNDVSVDTRVRDLTESEVNSLRETIEREFRVRRLKASDPDQHPALAGNWLLSGHPASPGPAGARSEEQKQCPYSPRPAPRRGR